MIYTNNLKNLLKEKYTYAYNENLDCFTQLTSKYVPIQKDFLNFWENNISTSQINDFDNELEIEEISSLFKIYSKSNKSISEEKILNIIKHFYPDLCIIEDKYILNIESINWNKMKDIENSFDFVKENIKNNYNLTLISFDQIYNYYYEFCMKQSNKLIVGKRYFEKYLHYLLEDHIVYDQFIDLKWINN